MKILRILWIASFFLLLVYFCNSTTEAAGTCSRKSQGDSNCDNKVDLADFEAFRKEFNGELTTKNADFDTTNTVTLLDFEIWRNGYYSSVTTLTPTQTQNSQLSIKIEGNHFVNQNGNTIRLLGVNRSGTQYMCYDGGEFFDGPSDDASIAAMKAWGINAVRVNLNEHCWLGLSDVPQGYGGAEYKNAIGDYVTRLNNQGLYVIIDMHHSGPGLNTASDMQPVADRDHAVAYWQNVASYFKNNTAVLFDLYNEPYPDNNADTTKAWTCVKEGGTCPGLNFQAEGMQQMLDAVRSTGAANPVLIAGPQYAGTLSRWTEFKPNDPINQLAASVHIYGQPLGSPYDDSSLWEKDIAPIAQQVPIVMGEIGDSDCTHNFIDQLMSWADTKGLSYFAWAWIAGNCANEPALIKDYNGTPSNYGIGFRDHLLRLPH